MNQNSGYGLQQAMSLSLPTTGRLFIVASSGVANGNYNRLAEIYPTDTEGVPRLLATPTEALSYCVAGNGDQIYIDPSYKTVLTSAELLSAETKGVNINGAGLVLATGQMFVNRVTSSLPATTSTDYFSVLGDILLDSVIGVVTTVVQTQANLTKLRVKKGSTTTDICAALDITAAAVGTRFSITGTFSGGLVKTAVGVPKAPQATPIFIEGGSTIQLTTAATNTGAMKFALKYRPQAAGAVVVAV